MEKLTLAQLNRTYLARQRLLEPSRETTEELITALGAVQAQEGPAPYFALAARLKNFKPSHLDGLRRDVRVVRATLHRTTVHLLTTADFLEWYALFLPQLEARLESWGEAYAQASEWREELMTRLGREEHTSRSVYEAFEETVPFADRSKVSPFQLMASLELVRPGGAAGESLGVRERWKTSEAHLGMRPRSAAEAVPMILRYLQAYGPASPADFSAWSGLRSPRRTMEELAAVGELRTYEDPDGRTLYDSPEGVILSGTEEPQLVQLLGDFDNAILGHQDRRRIVSDPIRKTMNRNIRSMAPILLRGEQVGVWQVKLPKRGGATAILDPFVKLSKAEKLALEARAEEALSMARPEATGSIQWAER